MLVEEIRKMLGPKYALLSDDEIQQLSLFLKRLSEMILTEEMPFNGLPYDQAS